MNLGNQQDNHHNSWFVMIDKVSSVVLPVALATLLSAPLWFVAARHYLGVQHPAWPFGIVLGGMICWRLFQGGLRRLVLHRLDIVIFVFMVTLGVSFCFRGFGNPQQAALFFSAFVGMPFFAGRLMERCEIKIFLYAMLVVVVLSLPLLAVELLRLTKADLLDDRIKGLFGAYYINNYVGLTVGGLVALLIALFVGPFESAWRRYKTFGLMILAVSLWLLVFIAARGGMVVGLIVGGAALLFGNWVSLCRRSVIMLFVVAVIIVSWFTLPPQRVHFMEELLVRDTASSGTASSGTASSGTASSGTASSGTASSGTAIGLFEKYTSPQVRLVYYAEALRLFRNDPIWGVGAGNLGYFGMRRQPEAFASPHSTLLQAFSELGLVGGGSFLAIAISVIAGLTHLAMSGNRDQLSGQAWLMLVLWVFVFLWDQISGNYFTSYHFYAVTGVVGGLLATDDKNVI